MPNDKDRTLWARLQKHVGDLSASVILARAAISEAKIDNLEALYINRMLQGLCTVREELIRELESKNTALETENKQLKVANQNLEAKVIALSGKQSLPEDPAPTTEVKPLIFGSHALKGPGRNAAAVTLQSLDVPDQSDSKRGPKSP